MIQLPAALRARMNASGHTQNDVEKETGVPQSQISRALNGQRKRPTNEMLKLCRYADLCIENESVPVLEELSKLLEQIASGGPVATACARGILGSLALLLRDSTERKGKA
ncbi:helix-turn-helix domain-containing protein [Solilutibacter silvestris]|uniref:helix-turn-helix domain-containing protein n=1 Tax=Solilutibacter silvestris TaxID=1645665 RepID=UPI0013FDD607